MLDLLPIVPFTRPARGAAEAVAEQAKAAGVALELRLPDELKFNADAGEMDIILNNLLTNAFEALEGHADAAVVVETHRTLIAEHPMLDLVVSDNAASPIKNASIRRRRGLRPPNDCCYSRLVRPPRPGRCPAVLASCQCCP